VSLPHPVLPELGREEGARLHPKASSLVHLAVEGAFMSSVALPSLPCCRVHCILCPGGRGPALTHLQHFSSSQVLSPPTQPFALCFLQHKAPAPHSYKGEKGNPVFSFPESLLS
jgi:hypothetical protein